MRKQEIEQIEREIKEEPFIEMLDPGLSKKERKKIVDTEFLVIDEKGRLLISGGGRILLMLLNSHFKTWENMINHVKTKGSREQYIEILRFKKKEKLYGLDLINESDPELLMIK